MITVIMFCSVADIAAEKYNKNITTDKTTQ